MFVSVFRRFPERIGLRRLKSRYLATSLTKRRLFRQTCSIGLALLLGSGVYSTVSRAERTRSSWGETREVFVAAHSIEGGAAIRAGDIEPREIPVTLLPKGALVTGGQQPDSQRQLIGRRTRSLIVTGEILTSSHLAETGRGKVAALLDDEQVAVTIRLPSYRQPVELGDQVDVYGRMGNQVPEVEYLSGPAGDLHGGNQPVRRVARSSRVVGLDADSGAATLLVNSTEAAAILTAADNGDVALVITG